MMLATHIAVGVLPAMAIRVNWWNLTAIAICAILPDLLHPHIWLTDRASWSHSWHMLSFALGMALFGCAMRDAALIVGATAIINHLGLDAVSGGISLLYPKTDIFGGDFIPRVLWLPTEVVSVGFLVFVCWRCHAHNRETPRPS